ncbi:VOC family protein [Cupriavidus lacunae]|uniref:Glyoxalase n=1 Tax=Cupriavidus lacunae TaxID=2666307 RepID=A0A370NNK4_9BURK|nr:VOC family protein [Cupriavidus lacunae]RDK07197.1 glyoxalase [Cupriavidus lacunae]
MSSLQTDTPLSLHHLHVTSDKPEALAAFYEDLFELARMNSHGDAIVLAAGERAVVIGDGKPGELAAAAYTARDHAALALLRARLDDLAEPPPSTASLLFHDDAFTVRDPQGRRLILGVARVPRSADRMAARVQHTVFQTTELEKVLDFYVNRIGFAVSDEVVDEDGALMTCFLRSDDEHHSLAFFRGSNNAWDHHCYETRSWNDIRDWGDRFARARRSIFFGPGRHGPGNNLFFMVTDPDGNRIELSAELVQVDAGGLPGVWPHEEYTLNSWGRGWIRT